MSNKDDTKQGCDTCTPREKRAQAQPCISCIDFSNYGQFNSDPVLHPAHYTFAPGFEVIKVIETWGLGYRLGNVVKYVARAGRKGDALEDLKKARWYIEREIAAIETPQPGGGA